MVVILRNKAYKCVWLFFFFFFSLASYIREAGADDEWWCWWLAFLQVSMSGGALVLGTLG